MSETETRHNLKIMGTTTSAGGFFQDVKVTGEYQFTGDVDCHSLSLTGNAKVDGSLRTDKLKITGEVAIEGIFEGGSLRGQGEVKVKSVRVEQLHLSGNLEVNGDCEGEQIQISGALNVIGLLSAEHLEINLFGPSAAKEVGGSIITIKRTRAGRLLHLVKQNQKTIFEAGLIEGDKVELNYTHADVVRGERVFIGAGCVIGTVEYRDIIEIHKNATVKHRIKI